MSSSEISAAASAREGLCADRASMLELKLCNKEYFTCLTANRTNRASIRFSVINKIVMYILKLEK